MATQPASSPRFPIEDPKRSRGKRFALLATRYRLVAVFCLLALVAIGLNALFVAELHTEIEKIEVLLKTNSGGNPSGDLRKEIEFLSSQKTRMTVLLAVLIACFGSIVYLFYRRVAIPLEGLTRAARRMSRGELSATVHVHPKHDFREIAQIINDMSANFQEVLLLMGTTVGNSQSAIEQIEKLLKNGNAAGCAEDLTDQIQTIRNDLELLSSVMREFEFYHTRFDGRKVVPTDRS
ncbi:MAG: methyl-accepting chemotaxis protein [Desulfomonile tiedjei]|uniref:Methyl-accepting chemotaxis protein n=1 Tax=Desulfomonile tiedjei TaxID=2358 RepID=A0A9D6UZU4_9BACT|nr:methyl-accepting chemotaxis protein [Desulfomonile tiedjei]